MTYKHANEDGIAAGWLVISVMLIVAAILYIYILQTANSIVSGPDGNNTVGINADINAGKISAQGATVIGFGLSVLQMLPLIFLLGGIVYTLGRALFVKQTGGG